MVISCFLRLIYQDISAAARDLAAIASRMGALDNRCVNRVASGASVGAALGASIGEELVYA